MKTVRTLVLFALAASCATVAEKKEIKAQNEENRAACEKMCEVAGDAEHNEDAVKGCKAKCVEPPIN